MRRYGLVMGLALITVAACQSSGDVALERQPAESSLPMWVSSPNDVSGFSETYAATGCSTATGNFSADKTAALASAMGELTRRANSRVASSISTSLETQASDTQTTASSSRTERGSTITNDRSTVELTNLFASETLTDARTHKLDYVTLDGTRNLCAMVYLDEDSKSDLVSRVNASLERQDVFFGEDAVYESLFKQEERERHEGSLGDT
ncbi:MAG: hypothetical protein AAF225_09090 [Pseudomonadota bacterium]